MNRDATCLSSKRISLDETYGRTIYWRLKGQPMRLDDPTGLIPMISARRFVPGTGRVHT